MATRSQPPRRRGTEETPPPPSLEWLASAAATIYAAKLGAWVAKAKEGDSLDTVEQVGDAIEDAFTIWNLAGEALGRARGTE